MMMNLVVSMILIVFTTGIHAIGLWIISRTFENAIEHTPADPTKPRGVWLLILIVLSIFVLHGLEIGLYAIVYLLVGAVQTVEAALYFSTSTFTTVGFGDIVLDPNWRLLSAIESANGFILIGWSTAYLVSIMVRLYDR